MLKTNLSPISRKRPLTTLFILITACSVISGGIFWRFLLTNNIHRDEPAQQNSTLGEKANNSDASLTLARTESAENPARKTFTERASQRMSFEANQGQTDSEVKFLSRGRGYNLFITPAETVLELRNEKRAALDSKSPQSAIRNPQSSVLRVKLKDAKASPQISGVEELPGRSNYFIGNDPSKWRTDVPTFAAVKQENVYPGTDLIYYGNKRELEYDFRVAPGGDPRAIRMSIEGAKASLDAKGDLILKTEGGEVRQHRPVVYQESDGERQMIDGRFVKTGEREIGFAVGAYDESRTLIIDPVLSYATYLGGSGDDVGNSIAVDSSGNAYVTGTTSSVNFPTKSPQQAASAGSSDVFVTKFDPTGANVIYSTYIGGALFDRGDGITVDASGNVYVVGRTDSTNFPATAGAFALSYRGGDFDGFAFKLNAQGSALAYATYLGGSDNDSAIGVAVDSAGNAYVTGGTRSIDFPATSTAFQTASNGDTEAFIAKINPMGSNLIYSTFLGGTNTDRGSSLAVDSAGNAYVAGYTNSSNFPTQNASQASSGSSFDAFIAKLNPSGSGLIYSTYLGGAGDDKGYGLALDSSGNLYVAGQTSSTNFPVLNAMQPASGGNFDAFIAKFDSAGTKLFATYLGGSSDDRASAIALNSAGNIYLTGFTSSTNFPTASPLQSSNAGGADAFVTKLDNAGSSLIYSTYFGGNLNESATSTITSSNNIVVDSSGSAYVTGYTASTNLTASGGFQSASGGGQDAFVLKISDTPAAPDFNLTTMSGEQTVTPGASASYNINVNPTHGFTGDVTLSLSGLPSGAAASFNPSPVSITDANPKSSVLNITTQSSTPPGTYTLTVTGTSGGLQHTLQITFTVRSTKAVDVAVSQTASPNPALVGATLTYRVVVTNNSPDTPVTATGVTLKDTLPANVTFVSATPGQGSCSGTSTVTCNLGSLAPATSAIVNINVTPTQTGQISNTVSVSTNESDFELTNNTNTLTLRVDPQASGPSMLDPNLSVRTVTSGLDSPTSMAFIGMNDFLVLEKMTGKVKRFVNGQLQNTVLDLAVNGASERGLLGIALHPNFVANGYVYFYWTESSTGADSTNLADVPLLGNRVDRFIWDGSALTLDKNIIKLRAYQADANQPLRGNHNGGVIRFGPDGKLYIIIGDNGRRGFLQNVTSGGTVPDDQFGGPEPDNAHFTGVIIRLNDDGTIPSDNPFFNAGSQMPGEAGANIQKIFAYGVRNSFGMAFDPISGQLWEQENGDDSFDEINRVTAGANGGWVQIMGPINRLTQYKQIETTYGTRDLQQLRWSPTLIADDSQTALSRLYNLPGSHYADPEFSWAYAVAPSPIGFVRGGALGSQYEGDLFVGASRTFLAGGYLFRLKLTGDRLHISPTDPRLSDRVADNLDKFDIRESESLLIGRDFGITTDIETAPNGNVFVVSLSNGTVYEISATPPTVFTANLSGAQETPSTGSSATGTATLLLSADEKTALVSLSFAGLSSSETAAHIHGPAATGSSAPVLFPLPLGQFNNFQISLTPQQAQDLKNGLYYINVHSQNFPNGEIRGQFGTSASAATVQFTSSSYSVNESAHSAQITVSRFGNTASTVTVDYATSDNTAQQAGDYTQTSGRLTFAPGETSKTFSVLITDDFYVEGSESLNLTLSNPTGDALLGSPSTATLVIVDNDIVGARGNPIEDAQFFVRQHYLDFLNREPDAGGLGYWTNEITKCGADAVCIKNRRIGISAAFFIENEFQQTGFYVYRVRRAALGTQPTYAQYLGDRNQIGLGTTADKTAFTESFAQRPEFVQKYAAATDASSFVGALITTVQQASNVNLSSRRSELIAEYNLGGTQVQSRARVIRKLVEYPEYAQAEYNPAFVLAQYFGYLRRDPDTGGYQFWLDVLNNKEPGNYRGMVCSFITSTEYQARFSQVIPRSNAECSDVR